MGHETVVMDASEAMSRRSACSVAVSYKPPMLVTRVRLPACASWSLRAPRDAKCRRSVAFCMQQPALLSCLSSVTDIRAFGPWGQCESHTHTHFKFLRPERSGALDGIWPLAGVNGVQACNNYKRIDQSLPRVSSWTSRVPCGVSSFAPKRTYPDGEAPERGKRTNSANSMAGGSRAVFVCFVCQRNC